MTTEQLEEIKEIYKLIGAYEKERDELIKDALPVGSKVRFRKGRGIVEAIVTMNDSYYDRLKIKNMKTGKEYWIEFYHIKEGFIEEES